MPGMQTKNPKYKSTSNPYYKRLSEQNYSPMHFNSKTLQVVPPYLTNLMEWLVNIKPTLLGSTGMGISPSQYLFQSSVVKMVNRLTSINEVRGKLNEWFKAMDATSAPKSSLETKLLKAPSMFQLRGDPWPPEPKLERNFSIIIEETPTIVLFKQNRISAIKGTTRALQFEEENESYFNYVKSYKKTNDMDTQTPLEMKLNKSCGIDIKQRANKETEVSCSDIYDMDRLQKNATQANLAMYNFLDSVRGNEEYTAEKIAGYIELQTNLGGKMKITDVTDKNDSDDDFDEFSEAKRMIKILESKDFDHVSLIMGRILERNVSGKKQQHLLKGNFLDPLAKEVDFNYNIEHVWTNRYRKVWGMPVTSLSINTVNNNIVAVGYGQYFKDQPEHLGRICIWNLKNSSVPERALEFKSGVTSIAFSRIHPFALLVAFTRGFIAVIDISQNPLSVLISKDDEALNCPIWQVCWFPGEIGENDLAVTCTEGGLVHWFTSESYSRAELLLLSRKEGTVKGVKVPKKCRNIQNVTQHPSIYCIAKTPIDSTIYLAGTDDGCVHICSTDYWTEHIDVFQAHDGPVYHIKYHPHTHKVFLTVGVDYCVQIWAMGIYEPLLTLYSQESFVEDADWSPTNPTIVATIAGSYLSIWDLRRIISEPCRNIRSPTDTRFNYVKFMNNGCDIICGDIHGDLHVYTLSNMPFNPTYKAESLNSSLKRLLIGNDEMLDELKKLGYPFDIDPV